MIIVRAIQLMSCFVHRVRPAPNEEVFVTFVKSLGVNELGVSRGYDMVSFFVFLYGRLV